MRGRGLLKWWRITDCVYTSVPCQWQWQ